MEDVFAKCAMTFLLLNMISIVHNVDAKARSDKHKQAKAKPDSNYMDSVLQMDTRKKIDFHRVQFLRQCQELQRNCEKNAAEEVGADVWQEARSFNNSLPPLVSSIVKKVIGLTATGNKCAMMELHCEANAKVAAKALQEELRPKKQ